VGGEHEREHGGERGPDNDVARWDQRYAERGRLWPAEPNPTVVDVVGSMTPGRALDLGTGEGRHATWLSQRGWQVTGVDFSQVGIARARRSAGADGVDWIVDDVRTWRPPAGTTYDLVLVVYLHVAGDVFRTLRGLLDRRGALVVVGHALRNLRDGVGGPRDPRLLYTEEQLRGAASGLHLVRLDEVLRPTADGTAIDLVLVATEA
jgi:SAM-dependent methyltransferase